MKFFIFIYIILFGKVCFSQNLVPNPSFEDYSLCPTASGQLSLAFPWTNPTNLGSPDYFNACSTIVGVPSYCNCSSVFQYPVSGQAHAGIWCFNKPSIDTREYVQNQLISPLTPNGCYFVKFYVNQINWAQYSCNNIALNFSVTQPVLTDGSSLMNLIPHIKDYNNRIIADTLNWKIIQGIYTAGGGENYITIGNFNTDATTDTLKNNTNGAAEGSFYNIDDVSVIPIDSIIGGMPAFAGNDVIISQEEDSAFIGQEISNLNCNWSILGGAQIATNTSGLFVQPITTTTYVVEQTLCGTVTYDTVTVYVTVGLEELNELTGLEIYPNPTNGKVTVSSSMLTVGELRVSVMDVTGKEVYNTQLSLNEGISHFSLDVRAGSYFVTLINLETNEHTVRKLTVQK